MIDTFSTIPPVKPGPPLEPSNDEIADVLATETEKVLFTGEHSWRVQVRIGKTLVIDSKDMDELLYCICSAHVDSLSRPRLVALEAQIRERAVAEAKQIVIERRG